jgi:hypothetical protein
VFSLKGESWYIESKEKREPGEEGEGEEAVSGGEGRKGNEVAGEGGGEADRMEKTKNHVKSELHCCLMPASPRHQILGRGLLPLQHSVLGKLAWGRLHAGV